MAKYDRLLTYRAKYEPVEERQKDMSVGEIQKQIHEVTKLSKPLLEWLAKNTQGDLCMLIDMSNVRILGVDEIQVKDHAKDNH